MQQTISELQEMHPMTKENRKLGKQTNSCPKCCQWKVVMVHLLPSCLLLTPPALSGTLVEYKKDKLHMVHRIYTLSNGNGMRYLHKKEEGGGRNRGTINEHL